MGTHSTCRGLIGLLLIIGLAGHEGIARAQADAPEGEAGTAAEGDLPLPEPGVAEARQRYAQGSEFYRLGRFAEAVAEFTEAYALWPNPTILYAMGQAYEGLSEANHAIATYERYLAEAPETDLRRQDAQTRIEELRGLLAELRVEVNVEATVSVDGEPQGAAPGPFTVPTGRHTILVEAEGHDPQTANFIIAGGTERVLTFELEPTPVAVIPEREPFRFPRPVFYTAVGLTGAALLTWGGFAIANIRATRDYNSTPGRTNLDQERVDRLGRQSNIALVVAGGLALSTLLIGLLTRWQPAPDADEEAEGDGANNVVVSVAPLRGGGLLTAGWTL